MNQFNFVSNPPYNQLAFEQESGTKKGVLILSGINTYKLESINTISGVKEPNSSFIAFDFKDKDISIGNNKHSLKIEKDRADSKYSFLQFNEDKPVKVQFGTSYTDDEGNVFIDDFNLTYKTGYLNLDKRPYVNGIAVLLSGEDGGGNIIDISDVVFTTGNQMISGFKDFRDGIYLNNENDVGGVGTKIIGNISGIQLRTFQNPIDITITNDFVGGNYDDVISVHNSPYTDSIFGSSINTVGFEGDQIVIYQTGSIYGNLSSKGPYLRLGTNNIISEKNNSKLGIGTLFPQEKVHISGGNLKVENTGIFNALNLDNIDNLSLSGVDIIITSGNVILTNPLTAPNLVYNTGNQSITGAKTFNSNVIVPNLADQFPPSTGIRRYFPEGLSTLNTVSPTSGWVQYFPFLIKENITNYNLCIEATTATATAIRLGIYSADSGMENAPLLWTGTISTNAVQIFRTSPSIPLNKGAYIMASCNTGSASPATYRSLNGNVSRSIFGEATGNVTLGGGALNGHYYSILTPPNIDLPQRISGESIAGSTIAPLVCIEY